MQLERERTKCEVYVHLTWATYRRSPLITADIQRSIYHMIESEAKNHQCATLAIGGLEDHIHILIKLPSTKSLSQVAQAMKGRTSRFICQTTNHSFKWQEGYSATSVNKNLRPVVTRYIMTQKSRHQAEQLWHDLE